MDSDAQDIPTASARVVCEPDLSEVRSNVSQEDIALLELSNSCGVWSVSGCCFAGLVRK